MSVNGDWICIINELFFSLHPTKIRFGVGVGNITTQIQKMNIQEMDGTAFHLARKAIEQSAKEKQKYRGNINYFGLTCNLLTLALLCKSFRYAGENIQCC